MSLIESIRNNSAATTAVAVVVLSIASLLIYKQVSGGASRFSNPKWMYDLNTGRLVVADADTPSPHESDTGTYDYGEKLGAAGAQVDVVVYSCGDPTDVEEGMTAADLAQIDARIAFLMLGGNPKPAGDGKSLGSGGMGSGLVSDIEGKEWFPKLSPRGMAIQDEGFFMCDDGSPATKCRP